jgi:adenylosuccinate synthase
MVGDSSPVADVIREVGGEFGTVTGRPRRIGWLDLPMLRHAARTSSFTGIAINHLDVLAELESVKIATGYRLDGTEIETVPPTTEQWARCEPIYREFEPWPAVDWDAVARQGYGALPSAATAYVDYVCDALSVPVYAVGVGPKRSQTIMVEHPFHL